MSWSRTCPNCGKHLSTRDVLNQIDAETQERAELCVACWKHAKVDKDGKPKESANEAS